MDDESQRLGLLPLPIRKTQLTYDQIPPFGRIGDFQSCVLFMYCSGGAGLGASKLKNWDHRL